MTTFLEEVAQDLYEKLNGDFSTTAIVFPNKRAGLFFDEYIAKISHKPMWSPVYVSISDLFQQLSDLKLGDRILLVSILYSVFKEHTTTEETLDSFFPWGQLLISDFDDVDKNLVDPDMLFKNLQELNEIKGDLSFLDEEQEKALQQFFKNFSIERNTDLKRKFNESWNHFNEIYHAFHQELTKQHIAYEGMLYRSVIENINTAELPYDKYVFVGFNVLNKVESRFFSMLKEAGKAMFYWDYDLFYCPEVKDKDFFEKEAGLFLRKNINLFGNELDNSHFDHIRKPKNITYISSSTENAQARYLSQWAQHLQGQEKENAVVLCNESLLLPVLHSIPDEVKNVNITMGFPLSQTPIYNFIKAVIDLQTNGFDENRGQFTYEYINLVLSHPYTQRKSEKAETILKELRRLNRPYSTPSELQQDDFLNIVFTYHDNNKDICQYLISLLKEIATIYRDKNENAQDIYAQLYQESIYQCFITINRLLTLIEDDELNVNKSTLNGLLSGILNTTSIPFHGEPAIGMQIMGVLETRNLDFNNLLIMSLNEGQLPKSGDDTSFIPYNLRKAFGLTTVEHKNSVYAYYFYRLIQRADNVTILYNTSTSGLNKGEMSRFMLQLLVELPYKIERRFLSSVLLPTQGQEITVEKDDRIMQQMKRLFDWSNIDNSDTEIKSKLLSPSALNKYLNCPLMFYFMNIAGLQKPDEVSMEIDSPLFGTIFHKAARLIYDYLGERNKNITQSEIDDFLKKPNAVDDMVDKAFKSEFFHVDEKDKVEYNGTQLINRSVIIRYLKNLLELDKQYAPFTMELTEKRRYEEYKIETSLGTIVAHLGGYIDRMDSKAGVLRIIDYKTGGSPESASSVEELFAREGKRASYIFQAFLYASIISNLRKDMKVKPALLFIHKASKEDYSSDIYIGSYRNKEAVEDINTYKEDFLHHLDILINEIFNQNIPFSQTSDDTHCAYCDFNSICKKV